MGSKANKVYSRLLFNLLFFTIIFFCTTERLFLFPIDKLSMVLMLLLILFQNFINPFFRIRELITIGIALLIAVLSSVVNLIITPMIYFPIVGIAFAIIFSKKKRLVIESLYYALIVHIIFGLVFVFLAFFGVEVKFVFSFANRGISFLFGERGFTTTVQTFGMLCILWLLLFFSRKDKGMNRKIDWFFYFIANFSILLTFNRSTYIFYIIVLFYKMRRQFKLLLAFFVAFIISFWEAIVGFLMYKGSLRSRSELLEGFNLSFWGSHSFLVYLFGKGTNQLPENILSQVKWASRSDIENGYAMLLHSYGFVGLLFYMIIGTCFALKFLRIKRHDDFFIVCYFLFIAPYFTQEYVTTSFYLFLAVLLYMYQEYISAEGIYRRCY